METDFSQATTIIFDPHSEIFTIHRPSFLLPDTRAILNSTPETAPHTLFTSFNPRTGLEETEALHIRIWRDNSVLEVFVNSRTAISTRLYAAEETIGIRFFADDDNAVLIKRERLESSQLAYATLWDGIGA